MIRFHFYGHDMTRQVEAHHFCAHQNEEFRQCLIYDRPDADGRLIGLEYIVSEQLFLTLPDEEKRFWHSHEFEVKSGVLFMPGVPGPIQRQDMEKVVKTYGKAIHFWQVDRGDSLPLGIPQVMMALTRDGQLYDNLAQGIIFIHVINVLILGTVFYYLAYYLNLNLCVHVDVEKRYNMSFAKERENRAYMKGLDHGIHPMANGGGRGLKTVLREVDCKPAETTGAARVFV